VNISVFWDIMPCSLVKAHVSEEHRLRLQHRSISQAGTQHEVGSKLAACFMLVSCLTYSSTLKMDAICSSETCVEFHRTTRHYIPEGRTLFYKHSVSLFNGAVSAVIIIVASQTSRSSIKYI
jgi:hypothetical protein